MIRSAAAVVVAILLGSAPMSAQETTLTVSVPSAEVHRGPSTVTPVIGHVTRGTVLPIARNLGSWVKIDWPDAPDGVGYVHVTMGRLGPNGADDTAMNTSPRPSAGGPAASSATPPLTQTAAGERVAHRGPLNVTPASHIFGVGGLVGSMNSFGATARAWRNNRIGIQVEFTRETMTSDVAAGRATSMQVEPGVVYALLDHVSDYVWIRPYVGSVASFRHQTLSSTAPLALEPASENGVGFRIFGGSELTFSSAPRFGLSADLGYRHLPSPFPGFETDPLTVSVAGHWYIK